MQQHNKRPRIIERSEYLKIFLLSHSPVSLTLFPHKIICLHAVINNKNSNRGINS